jgi:putative ABC transport system substrate-binding protein
MNHKLVSFILTIAVLIYCHFAEAQQPTNIPKIGYLSRDIHPADSRAPLPHNLEAFRQGLRELGYIEGKNIII